MTRSYWHNVLTAAWSQTAEWFRWGSWPQFVLRAGGAIIVIVAVGWLSGPAAALTTIGRTIAAVISAAVLFLPVYLAAIAVSAAKLDREKDRAIADLRKSLVTAIGRRVKQAEINAIAELRSEGISILNDVPKGLEDVPRWHARWTEWGRRAVDELRRNFTEAEALSFGRLGVIIEVTFGMAVGPKHNHYLMQLNKQLTILENLIDRHQARLHTEGS